MTTRIPPEACVPGTGTTLPAPASLPGGPESDGPEPCGPEPYASESGGSERPRPCTNASCHHSAARARARRPHDISARPACPCTGTEVPSGLSRPAGGWTATGRVRKTPPDFPLSTAVPLLHALPAGKGQPRLPCTGPGRAGSGVIRPIRRPPPDRRASTRARHAAGRPRAGHAGRVPTPPGTTPPSLPCPCTCLPSGGRERLHTLAPGSWIGPARTGPKTLSDHAARHPGFDLPRWSHRPTSARFRATPARHVQRACPDHPQDIPAVTFPGRLPLRHRGATWPDGHGRRRGAPERPPAPPHEPPPCRRPAAQVPGQAGGPRPPPAPHPSP